MAVARCQTVEDGPPRWASFDTLHQRDDGEFVRVEFKVRPECRPRSFYAERLVLRTYQATGEVTVALQALRTE